MRRVMGCVAALALTVAACSTAGTTIPGKISTLPRFKLLVARFSLARRENSLRCRSATPR